MNQRLSMKIIDNFLPEEEFESIRSLVMGLNFPWFYFPGTVTKDDGQYYMVHMFFQPEVGTNSNHVHIWDNFMGKVGAVQCKRVKANLTFPTLEHEPTTYHIDYPDLNQYAKMTLKTAVFFVTTNNGYTEFKNGVRVPSVANRVCIFNSNLMHRGVTHTEGEHQRIVVNFNYYETN